MTPSCVLFVRMTVQQKQTDTVLNFRFLKQRMVMRAVRNNGEENG